MYNYIQLRYRRIHATEPLQVLAETSVMLEVWFCGHGGICVDEP